MTLEAADQFHIGIVVDEFESTLVELSDVLGHTWGEEISSPTDVKYADGTTGVVQPSFVYSTSVPRLEIIRVIPGTLWEPASSGVHHLGYWSDDVELDGAALVQGGFAPEVMGVGPGGDPYWSYHRNAIGLRIELVSRSLQPMMEEYFATGRIPTFNAAPADASSNPVQDTTS